MKKHFVFIICMLNIMQQAHPYNSYTLKNITTSPCALWTYGNLICTGGSFLQSKETSFAQRCKKAFMNNALIWLAGATIILCKDKIPQLKDDSFMATCQTWCACSLAGFVTDAAFQYCYVHAHPHAVVLSGMHSMLNSACGVGCLKIAPFVVAYGKVLIEKIGKKLT